MTKVVPIILLAFSIIGAILSLIGLIFALLCFFLMPQLMVFAVIAFVIACFFNAFSILGGVVFKSRICKVAMVISIISAFFILVGFILIYSR